MEEDGGGWRRMEEDGGWKKEEGDEGEGDPWVLAFIGLSGTHIFKYNTARTSQALALSPSFPFLSLLFSSLPLSLILSLLFCSPARTVSTGIDPVSGSPPASPFPKASPQGGAPLRGPGSGWMSSTRTPCRASPLCTVYHVPCTVFIAVHRVAVYRVPW